MRRTVVNKLPSLQSILQMVEQGTLTSSKAEKMILTNTASKNNQIKLNPADTFESFANLDHTRTSRTGFPEAIFAAGKTPTQIVAILENMASHVNEAVEEYKKNNDTDKFTMKDLDSYRAILATR